MTNARPSRRLAALQRAAILCVSAGFMAAPNCAGVVKGCGKGASKGASKGARVPFTLGRGAAGGAAGHASGGRHVADEMVRLADDTVATGVRRGAGEGLDGRLLQETAGEFIPFPSETTVEAGDDTDLEEPAAPGTARGQAVDSNAERVTYTLRLDNISVHGSADKGTVEDKVYGELAPLAECFIKTLNAKHTVAKRVRVMAISGFDGRMMKVEAFSTGALASSTQRCLEARIGTWRFPPPAKRVYGKMSFALRLAVQGTHYLED